MEREVPLYIHITLVKLDIEEFTRKNVSVKICVALPFSQFRVYHFSAVTGKPLNWFDVEYVVLIGEWLDAHTLAR